MRNSTQVFATVFLGLAVLVGSFAVASPDFAYGSQSLLAATVSLFSSKPLLTISKNVNSPAGSIVPGRSQVFAVFDVKGQGFSEIGHINTLPVFIWASGNGATDLSINNVTLNYKYCRPRGNIYAYGYKYGYSGLYCVSITTTPQSGTVSSSRDGQGLQVSFSGIDFPVFPDQVSAILTISGNPYYKNAETARKSVAKVQARLLNGIIGTTESCRVVHYGYKNRYGYTKCSPLPLSTNLWIAYGNVLTVLRGYGYGYPVTPPVVGSLSATPTVGNAPLTVEFSGASGQTSSEVLASLDFGDGEVDSTIGRGSFSKTHTYSSAGKYTATLSWRVGAQANAKVTSKTVGSVTIKVINIKIMPDVIPDIELPTTVSPTPDPVTVKSSPTCAISANTNSVTVGQTVTLKWTSANAAYVVDSAGAKQSGSGSGAYSVTNAGINVFTFTAYDGIDKQTSCSVSVLAVVAQTPTETPATVEPTAPKTVVPKTVITNPFKQFFQTQIE